MKKKKNQQKTNKQKTKNLSVKKSWQVLWKHLPSEQLISRYSFHGDVTVHAIEMHLTIKTKKKIITTIDFCALPPSLAKGRNIWFLLIKSISFSSWREPITSSSICKPDIWLVQE